MVSYSSTLQGYDLLHQGTLALADVEANGMRIDVDYMNRAITHTTKKIKTMEGKLKETEVCKQWRKRYGAKFNLDSRDQLAKILFGVMGYESTSMTSGGKPKADAEALNTLDVPFVKKYLKIQQLKKARSTYLIGILREVDNGFLHPSFNLNIAQTFRSSSSSPNFQNIPVRDPQIAKLIRRAFIPRRNGHIVEIDFSGVEVNVAACYHKDPRMIKYLLNPKMDMHRDMSQQCYMLSKAEMLKPINKEDNKRIKNIRYCGKNKFVFPQFYGDWYLSCCQALWNAIGQMDLHTRDGLNLYDHLKSQGVRKLGVCNPKERPRKGTFENHLKDVEKDFWGRRFKVYDQWKKDWWKQYTKTGKFTTLTGFTIEGVMRRNEVINYPVQGSAFHVLLWCLIELNKELKRYKFKSKIVGQIHDSIVGDVRKGELKDYLQLANEIMTERIMKEWDWLIVPLEVEAEVAPLNKSWYHKEVYTI